MSSYLCELIGNVNIGMVAHYAFPIWSHTDFHVTKPKDWKLYSSSQYYLDNNAADDTTRYPSAWITKHKLNGFYLDVHI